MWVGASNHRRFLGVAGALVGVAWIVLWLWGLSPYARFLSHQELDVVRWVDAGHLLIFAAGWTLMITAMMLPSSLPLVTAFRTLVRQRRQHAWLLALLLAGYLAVWSLFGLVVHLGDWRLHQAVARSPWLQAHVWLLGVAPLLLAGLYQFTPLKDYCLKRCRSPVSFIAGHWHGRRLASEAFWLGVHHGLFCLGCCWSLMLLMFAVGVGNLGWMLALGTVMFSEKTMPWGRQLSAPLGVLLIGSGLLLTLGNTLVLR